MFKEKPLKYKSLPELLKAWNDGEIIMPAEGELRIIVDNDHVLAEVHPGWDDDGEELGDPEYIYKFSGRPEELLVEALHLLGLPAEEA